MAIFNSPIPLVTNSVYKSYCNILQICQRESQCKLLKMDDYKTNNLRLETESKSQM